MISRVRTSQADGPILLSANDDAAKHGGSRDGEGRAAPPPPWFPPLDPLFRGAPWTRYPQGGETHPGTPGHPCRASRGAGVPLGGAARPHGPRRRPSGHDLCRSHTPAATRGRGDSPVSDRTIRRLFLLETSRFAAHPILLYIFVNCKRRDFGLPTELRPHRRRSWMSARSDRSPS